MIEKKWIFIGIGVFIVVVGMVSWGVATDWKFFGDNSNKSGGGSEPTPPSQPTDNCEGKCKENEICCQSLRDGTTKKCCPNTMSDPVFDGDKCCSRNNIVDGECCDNPSKNTILSTSFFKNTYGKQCCDSKTFDKSDSNGCYELCGDNTTKCYQLKGEYCGRKDSVDGQYQCVSNPACQWESLPSPSPITDQSMSCTNNSDCMVGTCDKLNNTCNIKTVGLITDGNEFKGDKYRFTFKADDYKPKKWFFQRQMEVQESTTGKNKCTDIDCSIAFANNNRDSPPVLKDGVCSAKQNLDKFNTTNKKCPFEDTTRCCNKSDTNTEFSGQICAAGKVGAINKEIATSGNGYLSECVDKNDCVDSNGKICGGNGYCQYDINGGGKCVCNPDKNYYKYGGKYCKQAPDYDACKKAFSPYVIKTDFWGNVTPPICGEPGRGGPACVGGEGDPGSCCSQNDGYCNYTIACNSGEYGKAACRQCFKDRGCGGAYNNIVLESGITTLNKIKKLIQNIKGNDNIDNLNTISNVINTEIEKIDTTKFDKLKHVSILPLLNNIIKQKVTNSEQIKTMFKNYINNEK